MMSTRGLYPLKVDFPTYFLLQYVALLELQNLPQTVKLAIPQRTRRLRVRDEVTRRMTMTRSLPAQVLLVVPLYEKGFALREIGKSACNDEGSVYEAISRKRHARTRHQSNETISSFDLIFLPR
jgi:hypothetical protein